MENVESPRMFSRRRKATSNGTAKNSNRRISRASRASSSMKQPLTPGARSQTTSKSFYSSNKGSFAVAMSELEKEDEEENTWYERMFKRAAKKVEERRERRKQKKAKRIARKLEKEKSKPLDDFDPGTDGFEFYRWNGRRLQAEIYVFVGTMVFVMLFCIFSIFLYCFAFRGVDSAVDGSGQKLFNITSSTYIGEVEEHPWTIIDAIYFTSTSFLGNGFGDVVPTSAVGRIYAIVIMMSSLISAGAAVGAGLSDMVKQQVNRRHNLKAISRRVFIDQYRDGSKIEDCFNKSHYALIKQWKADAVSLGYLVLIGVVALLLGVVGGGLGLWAMETTYYHLVTHSMAQVRGEPFRRQGPEAPGFSVYLFACTAGRFTYGDVMFPSDMLNRFISCFTVFVLVGVHTGFTFGLANLLMNRFLWMDNNELKGLLLCEGRSFNAARDLEDTDTAAMECLLSTVKQLLPSEKLNERKKRVSKRRRSTLKANDIKKESRLTSEERKEKRKSVITFSGIQEEKEEEGEEKEKKPFQEEEEKTREDNQLSKGLATKSKNNMNKKKRVSIDVLETPSLDTSQIVSEKDGLVASSINGVVTSAAAVVDVFMPKTGDGQYDAALLEMQGALVSLGLVDATFFKHCDDWFQHLATKDDEDQLRVSHETLSKLENKLLHLHKRHRRHHRKHHQGEEGGGEEGITGEMQGLNNGAEESMV